MRTVTLGVLLDSSVQENWVLESLRQALAVPGARIAAIAVTGQRSSRSVAARLHRLMDAFDSRLRSRNEELLATVDVAAELKAPLLDVAMIRSGEGWYPDAAGLDALRRIDVDVWLCFTALAPRRPLPAISRLGVWAIEIGQDVPATSPWAGASEVGAGSPVTMASIVDYSDAGNGLLYRSFGATLRNSAHRNRLSCLRKCMSFFRRRLERLALREDLERAATPATSDSSARYPVLREPTVPAVARLSSRLVSTVAGNRLRALGWRDQWQIAYYFKDRSEALDCRFERLRYLVPPKDRFWADPFAVEHQGRCFIFFEELTYRSWKGRIMVVEVFESAEPGEPQPVLERPYHLSYPFMFNWEGAWYLLPETADNRTVELYRCEEFPLRWNLHRVLLDNVRAYDATLWEDGGQWWMFVNIAEPGADSSDELHLYRSATPLGPWTAHRDNPVISDVRCARPAGPLFRSNGTLYRPSQDCSLAYGYAVSINRVDAIGDGAYRETAVRRVAPGWRKDILCTHTFGGSNRLRVIDYLVSRQAR